MKNRIAHLQIIRYLHLFGKVYNPLVRWYRGTRCGIYYTEYGTVFLRRVSVLSSLEQVWL